MEWEKVFANNVKDKGLTSKTYTHKTQDKKKKSKKWVEDLNIYFFNEKMLNITNY